MVSRCAHWALAFSSVAANDPWTHTPQKGGGYDQACCGESGDRCDPGTKFDHWQEHALSGAISKICFKLGSVKAIHDKDWITGGQFCYGDRCMSQGTGGGDCFDLTTGEVIMGMHGTCGTARGAKWWGISSITVTLSSGRSHFWGDRECDDKFNIQAPQGKHITSFFGLASGGHAGWGGLFSNLGVYYDNGAANGQWKQIGGGPGVDPLQFEYSVCTTDEASHSTTISKQWSIAAMSETSFGFELEGMSSQQKRSVTREYARSITTSTESSFSTTVCDKVTQKCDPGLRYAFQFQFMTNFDGNGARFIKTSSYACTDTGYVCCLPNGFVDPNDASKGCKEGQYICDGPDPHQRWLIVNDEVQDIALTVDGKADLRTPIKLSSRTSGATSQMWLWQTVDSGYGFIIHADSGLCLVPNSEAHVGGTLILYKCNHQDHDYWETPKTGNQIKNKISGLCITWPHNSSRPPVYLYGCGVGNEGHQHWDWTGVSQSSLTNTSALLV